MNRLLTDVDSGRKNILFGVGLFLLFGVLMGIPLTINFFGGSVLGAEQYQAWKVVHGYGVFLAIINYLVGASIDRLALSRREKEAASWSFVLAGVSGGILRLVLLLFSALGAFGLYASLGETVFITLGTAVFVLGQLRGRVPASGQLRPAGTVGGRQTPA
jgi:hypothetical protein